MEFGFERNPTSEANQTSISKYQLPHRSVLLRPTGDIFKMTELDRLNFSQYGRLTSCLLLSFRIFWMTSEICGSVL